MGSSLSFKILIIGDKEVGRSTLLKKRFKCQYFHDSGLNVVGVSFYTTNLTLEGRDNRLTIWYVSNLDKFRPILPNFIVGTHGVVLMFDVTNSSTLDFLFNYPCLIREQAGDIPILLVGNKVDLGVERVIPKEEGTAFARTNDLLKYIEISAKIGQGCEGIFEILIENIMTQLQLN